MTRDILTQCDGWTPVIDHIAGELGLMTAVVYGVVWRYCQMRTGMCYASVKTLAQHLGLSEKSVRRHLKNLVEAGYIEDTTPDLRNRPHTYRDTAKVELRGSIKVVVGQRDQPKSGGGTESPTDLVRESSEDTIQDTTAEEDTNSSLPSSGALEATVDKFCRKFGDVHHKEANVTQAYNLWNESSLEEDEFLAMLERAGKITLEAVGKSQIKDRGKRMAYFFAVLRGLLISG